MSDMMETETGDEMATRIAAVGTAVATAAEQLKRAAKRLLEEEEQVVADKERNALKDAVASEVRLPTCSTLGIALAMKDTDPKAREGQDIRQLSSDGRKLDRLVSVRLEQDRLMEGSLRPSRRRTDLQSLDRRVVEEPPYLANGRVHVEGSHFIVAVDRSMTEQMVDPGQRRTASCGREPHLGDDLIRPRGRRDRDGRH